MQGLYEEMDLMINDGAAAGDTPEYAGFAMYAAADSIGFQFNMTEDHLAESAAEYAVSATDDSFGRSRIRLAELTKRLITPTLVTSASHGLRAAGAAYRARRR
jgi:hypothetical protein